MVNYMAMYVTRLRLKVNCGGKRREDLLHNVILVTKTIRFCQIQLVETNKLDDEIMTKAN